MYYYNSTTLREPVSILIMRTFVGLHIIHPAKQ